MKELIEMGMARSKEVIVDTDSVKETDRDRIQMKTRWFTTTMRKGKVIKGTSSGTIRVMGTNGTPEVRVRGDHQCRVSGTKMVQVMQWRPE
jgi:hypothetical protein